MSGDAGPSGRSGLTVTVIDETDSLGDLAIWADLVSGALAAEGVVGPAETNVVFVDVEAMAELNDEHMGQTGPTDVLSFPIDGADVDGTGADEATVRFVGDIVVCPAVAFANAPDHAGTERDELALLLVHGSLHLLGHDHAEVDERAEMWAAEQRLLSALWTPMSRNPWADS